MSAHRFDDQIIVPALQQQLSLLEPTSVQEQSRAYYSAPDIDISDYDRIVLCMSGGKDSIACLLHLIEIGADLSKVELWHHDVDGREGARLMDWAFMADYNRKLAETFNLPLYFSWLDGGFEGEMLKQDSYSRPHKIETPDGLIVLERDTRRASPGTRLKFPQLSPSLQTRWCSSALKIDVGRRGLNNQTRFDGHRILFITGERREESSNRAKYNQLEPHFCDRRNGRKARHVDAWRPVLHWSEEEVWSILERHRVIAPVPYRLGWSRSSCMTCIYNGPRVWATIQRYFPERAVKIARYEDQFGITISRDKINVLEVADSAKPFEIDDLEALEQAFSTDYYLPVLQEGGAWHIPPGAYGREGCGAI